MKPPAKAKERTRVRKQELRERCLRKRQEQLSGIDGSRRICSQLAKLPEYRAANTLGTYVSMPWEVQTLELIEQAWHDGKTVAVPCCMRDRLRLFHLQSMDELVPRTLGIPEPRSELRRQGQRWLDVAQIDLFVVPGLAFDRTGGRLGHGKGYYDRLLADAAREAPKIALAFDHQVIDCVPMTASDVFMDCVFTETAVYRCHQA